MSRILVVEDEHAIAALIAINLRHAGFDVLLARDEVEARGHLEGALPDLILLDWMLPGQSGLSLAKRWRADTRMRHVPIIMLTARSQESDKIAGLDAGADDYLVKPFSINELLARMRAVLRRRAPETTEVVLEVAGLRLDPALVRVTRGGQEIKLGPTEFRLLRHLMSYPERVHSRAQLLDRVWGDQVDIEERTVDVHIKRLREALAVADCAALVDTVRGVGYRFLRVLPAAV